MDSTSNLTKNCFFPKKNNDVVVDSDSSAIKTQIKHNVKAYYEPILLALLFN